MTSLFDTTLVDVLNRLKASELKDCKGLVFCPESGTAMTVATHKVKEYIKNHIHDEAEKAGISIDLKNIAVFYCNDCNKIYYTKKKSVLSKYV
jgi:hypothetical protein